MKTPRFGGPRPDGSRPAKPPVRRPGPAAPRGPRPPQAEAADAPRPAKAAFRPGGKPERGDAKFRPRADHRPDARSDARPAARADQRPAARADARPGKGPTARVENRPDARVENRPERADKPVLSLRARPDPAPTRAPEVMPERAHSRTRATTEAPRGTVWLYGSHAVAAALANPNRRLRRLLLTEEAHATLSERLSPPWSVQPERVDRARLDLLLGRETVHQGVALLADLLTSPSLAQALERRGPVLVLDQVSDPRNVGAILRCAAAFGVAAVIVQERHAPDETGALAKAASGALETVPLLRAVNLARTLIALKAAGLWTVGLDAGGGRLSGPALTQRRVALVLGAEGEGLRRLTRETCDEISGIAMPGGSSALDSLNVAAAAAVGLYELGRRP